MEEKTLEQEIWDILKKHIGTYRAIFSDTAIVTGSEDAVQALASFIRSRDRDIAEKTWDAAEKREHHYYMGLSTPEPPSKMEYLSQFSSPINSKTDE